MQGKKLWNNHALYLALAALLLPATCVVGQEAEIEEIVVLSNFQKSVRSGIEQKRDADTQIDAFGIGDIGVLPGRSVAETIARLPGVSGIRSDLGVMNTLVVRGSTDLTMGTLNGREQVTMDHDGSRNVNYHLYPTHVLSAIQVAKTTSAGMSEGGVSGTINMDTIKPLAFDSRRVVVNAEVNQYGIADDNARADDNGGVLSLTYIDQLSDNFGIAIGLGMRSESIGRTSTQVGGWQAFNGGGFGGEAPDIDGDGALGDEAIPFNVAVQTDAGTEESESIFIALQYKNDNFDINFDHLSSSRDRDRMQAGAQFQGLPDANIDNGKLGSITYTTMDGLDFVGSASVGVAGQEAPGFGAGASGFYVFNNLDQRNADMSSTGLNVTWQDDGWTVVSDLYNSQASLDYYIVTGSTYRFASTPGTEEGFGCPCPASAPDLTLTTNLLGNRPNFSVAEDILDPGFYAPRQASRSLFQNDDDLFGFSVDVTKELAFDGIRALNFGVRYTDRQKNVTNPYNVNSTGVLPDNQNALTSEFVDQIIYPKYGPAFPVFDPEALYTLHTDPARWQPGDSQSSNPIVRANSPLQNSGSVIEETTAAYVQLDFETNLFNIDVSGNAGVRHVSTDSESPGFRSRGDRYTTLAEAIDPVPANSYSEFLPSLNLKFQVSDTQDVRLGVGKVMSRAPLDNLRSTEIVTVGGFGVTATGGNPALNPTVATQASLAYGYYPSEDRAITVGVFYNDLDSYVGETILNDFVTLAGTPEVPESVDGFGNVTPAVPAQPETSVPYSRTTQDNMAGGYIRGVELRIYTLLDFISPILDTTGIDFNYTVIESNVQPTTAGGFGGPGVLSGLAGLAEGEGKLSLFTIHDKVEARLNYDYRDSILVEGGFGAFNDMEARTLVSFLVSYQMRDALKVGVFGQNITNEPQRDYTQANPALTSSLDYFGSVYGVKVSYELN